VDLPKEEKGRGMSLLGRRREEYWKGAVGKRHGESREASLL